jgi:hypothetical protein
MTDMKFGFLAAVAVCCIALSGCAADFVDASQSACRSFGLTPGTEAFSQCVRQEANMRDDAVNRAPAKGGAHGPQIPGSAPVASVVPVPTLKRSYVSGADKFCLYNQAGNEIALKIGANAVCPQTLQ